MARQSVAYRLVSEGKTQLINDFREIGDSGDASAKRIGRAFERDARDAEDALKKLEATAAKLAMAVPNAAGATNNANPVFRNTNYSNDNAGNFDGGMRSAQASAQALFAEQDRLIAQRNVILAQIDPMFAAQMQYNGAIENATMLRQREILTEEQFIAVERAAKDALDDASRAHIAGGVSMGQMRAGSQQLGYQMQDLGVQLTMAAGSGDVLKGSLMALTMQGPQVVSAISLMKGEAGGLIGFLSGPWGAAFMAATSVAAILGTTLLSNADAEKEAEKAAKDHAQAVKSLREQLRDAVQSAEDRARATYMEAEAQREAEVATRKLTQAKLDLAKADLEYRVAQTRGPGTARSDVSAQGIVGAQEELKRLSGLIAENNRSVTEAELAANRARGLYQGEILSSTMDPVERVRRRYRQQETAMYEAGGDPEKMANELRKLREARDAEIKTIQASQRAVRDVAQTRTDGATATPSQVSKLLMGEFGGTITSTTGGRHVKGSDHYRGQAVDFVPRGGMDALTKEQIRAVLEGAGLTVKQLLGPGDKGHNDHFHVAWSGGRFDPRVGQTSTEMADERRKSLGAAIGMEGVGVMAKNEQAAIDAVAEAQKKFEQDERARQERAQSFLDRTALSQSEDLDYLAVKERMMGANDNAIDAELSKLRLIHDARREGVNIQGDEFQTLLAANEALEDRRRLLDEQKALWEETRRFGERAIDTLFDIRSAESWGDRVKSILVDLMQEMLMLAALNPLKNALFGSGLPTMGSGGGLLGGLLGGLMGGSGGGGAGIVMGGAFNSFVSTGASTLPSLDQILKGGWSFDPVNYLGSAVGTEHTSGGAMWLAENGPELVSLPRGSRVTPAHETRRLLGGANDNRPSISMPISIDATGADAAGLARVEARLEDLQRSMPEQIARTMMEVDGRSHGRWRGSGR